MFLYHIRGGGKPASVYSSSYSQCVQFFWLFFLMSCIKTFVSCVNSDSIGYNPSNTATAIQIGRTFWKQHKLTSLRYFYHFLVFFCCLKKEGSTCVLCTQMSQLRLRTKKDYSARRIYNAVQYAEQQKISSYLTSLISWLHHLSVLSQYNCLAHLL